MTNKPNTIVIDNFNGRLTRVLNGSLNSGFSKFSSSFGYDPFSKPMNLTWLYQPDDIASSTITDAVLASKIISPTTNEQYVYAIGNAGRVYKIDPTNSGTTNTPLYDTPSLIGTISGTFNYGSDLDYYNDRLQITNDALLNSVTLAGSVTGTQSVTGARYHPVIQFQGSFYVGNGGNIMEINSTGLIVNGAKLSPALPSGMFIRDLDVTPDGIYMIITASYVYPDRIDSPTNGGRVQAYATESYKFFWNGTDTGVTSYEALPSFPANALNTFLDSQFVFMQDAFGAAIYEGTQKLLTLPNNLTPMPNGAAPNGTFLTWVSPEGTGTVNSSATTYGNTFTSLYYYGKLDNENPAGLWRLMRQAPSASNVTYRTPMNQMVNSFSLNRQFVSGWGKHYISVWEYNSGGASSTYHFYRFVLPPAANTAPILGVYETQTQLFSKRISVKQIRVYTEPTATNNGFQLDMIGADGNVLTNGTFTYTFAAGSDETRLQGALERINFNPTADTGYSLGIRITNTGTTNMTIKKIEVDWEESGK